jgi:hypothetical protein
MKLTVEINPYNISNVNLVRKSRLRWEGDVTMLHYFYEQSNNLQLRQRHKLAGVYVGGVWKANLRMRTMLLITLFLPQT